MVKNKELPVLIDVRYYIVLLLVFLAWPPQLVLYLTLVVWKKALDLTLKIWFGKKYGGLMDKRDVAFLIAPTERTSVGVVIILKTDKPKDMLSFMTKRFKKQVFDHPNDYPKLTGTHHWFLGYPYWIKNSLRINNCVKELQLGETYDEEDLKTFCGKHFIAKYPENNTGLWDTHVSRHPMTTQDNDTFYRYPFFIRIHHAVSDGTSMIQFVTRIAGHIESEVANRKLFEKYFNMDETKKYRSLGQKVLELWQKTKKTIIFILYVLFIGLGKFIYSNSIGKHDENKLHKPNQVGDKYVAWAIEKEPQLVALVKKIKNTVTKTQFSAVLGTGVLSSISNYFRKQNLPLPDNISAVMTVLLDFIKMDTYRPVPLVNNSVSGILTFDLEQSKSYSDTLRQVQNQLDKMNYWDLMVFRLVVEEFLSLFPMPVLRFLDNFGTRTLIISCMPGNPLTHLSDGTVAESAVPLAPNVTNIGITFVTLTYDNKFHCGLVIDKSLVGSQKVAQELVNDVFTNLTQLAAELGVTI